MAGSTQVVQGVAPVDGGGRVRKPSSFWKKLSVVFFSILAIAAVGYAVFFLLSQKGDGESAVSAEVNDRYVFGDELRRRFYEDGYETTIDYFMKQNATVGNTVRRGENYLELSREIMYVFGEERLEDALRYAKIADSLSESGDAACYVSGATSTFELSGYDEYEKKCRAHQESARDLDSDENVKEGKG